MYDIINVEYRTLNFQLLSINFMLLTDTDTHGLFSDFESDITHTNEYFDIGHS